MNLDICWYPHRDPNPIVAARWPSADEGLIHNSDRGVQYLAMNDTQRQAEANLVPSVGSVGDLYNDALAATINGLYNAEVIWRQPNTMLPTGP